MFKIVMDICREIGENLTIHKEEKKYVMKKKKKTQNKKELSDINFFFSKITSKLYDFDEKVKKNLPEYVTK